VSDVVRTSRHTESPEGMFRSLRTQQRAYPIRARAIRVSCCNAAVLTGCRARMRELVSVPPLSYLRETFARAEAFWAGEPA
jgi:hypothetical protein